MASTSSPRAQVASAVPDEAAAIKQFETAIADYMALRRRLANETPNPVPNSSAVQLNTAVDGLADAIERSRQNAGVGDLFVAPVTVVFKRTVDDAIRTANLRQALATIDDEEPSIRAPKIHLRFPAGSQLATTPASLLNLFPTLPKGLDTVSLAAIWCFAMSTRR